MNAAFLLVTSACLVGQAAIVNPGTTPLPSNAPYVASSSGPSYGSDCNGGCDSYGHRLRDRLRGMFSRDCHDSCQPSCCTTTHHSHASCCTPKIWTWQPRCHNTCAPAHTCNTCDHCDQHSGFLGRLRGMFRRGDCGCDGYTSHSHGSSCANGSCANGSCAPSVINPNVINPLPGTGPGTEKIQPPVKKMPTAPTKEGAPKQQEVRINNQPNIITPLPSPSVTNPQTVNPQTVIPQTTNPQSAIPQTVNPQTVNPSIPMPPNVEVIPIPAPRVEGDRRDPF